MNRLGSSMKTKDWKGSMDDNWPNWNGSDHHRKSIGQVAKSEC